LGDERMTKPDMSKKIKILVVEDEAEVASLMAFLLTRAGYGVQVALREDDGLELAKQEKFDLIILNVDLPGINGFEICRELKQRHISYHTPIVFVTDRADEASRNKAFALGAVDFIEKPFPADDFIARIACFAQHEHRKSNMDTV
jgi:DNA-binding response OmpR family regulator